MIYLTEFSDDPNFEHLQDAFEQETNSNLFDILEEYKQHNDYLELKVKFQELSKSK